MWLKNDILKVFFDERRGGMPVKDNFGFLRAAAIEIAYTHKPPFFQSLNDESPNIEKHGNTIVASGIMRRGLNITPHAYTMKAVLEGNKLRLSYALDVVRTERIVRSKTWVWVQRGRKTKGAEWVDLYKGEQRQKPVIIDGLKISGSTIPPGYERVCRLGSRYEVVYGWARITLPQGIYSGNLTLTYKQKPLLNSR